MSSIDKRIVEMQFNNREFEKGVSTTMSSLNQLDQQLQNFGKDAAKDFGSNLNKGLDTNIGAIESKFSALESTLNGIFLRLGSQIEEMGLNLVKSLSIDNITAGWSKYESIVMNTAGLANIADYQGIEYQKVLDYLDELQWYADSTSFSMGAMTTAFLSAVNAGTSMEDAKDVIKGMGNSFTYAGASATQMEGAFAMLSKVMSNESSMTQNIYRSLEQVYKVITPELRDRFVQTALEMGKITAAEAEVIAQDFRASLSANAKINSDRNGTWLTGDVVKAVYGTQYGEYTGQIYEFTQTWKNLTEAEYDAAYELINYASQYDESLKSIQPGDILQLTEAIALYNASMELADESLDEFGMKTLIASTEAKTLTETLDAVKDAVSSSWSRIFASIFGDYKEAKVLYTDLNNYLVDIFATPINNVADVVEAFSTMNAEFELFNGEIVTLSGREVVIEVVKNLGRAVESLINPLKKVADVLFPKVSAEDLFNVFSIILDFTKKLIIPDGINTLLETAWTILLGIVKVIQQIGKVAFGLIATVWEGLQPGVDLLRDIISYVGDGVNKVINFFSNLNLGTSLFNDLVKVATGLFVNFKVVAFNVSKLVVGAFGKIWEAIKPGIEMIGETLVVLGSWMNSLLEELNSLNIVENLITKFGKIIYPITKAIKEFFNAFAVGKTVFASVEEAYSSFRNGVEASGETYEKIKAKLGEIYDQLVNIFGGIFATIGSAFNTAFNTVKGWIEKVIAWISTQFGKTKEEWKQTFIEIKDSILYILSQIVQGISSFIKKIFKNTADVGEEAIDQYAELRKRITSTGGEDWLDNFSEAFKKIAEIIKIVLNLAAKFIGLDLFGDITKTLKNFNNTLRSAPQIANRLGEALGAFTDSVYASGNKIKISMVKTIASSVLLIALSMLIISTIDTEAAMRSISAMALIVAELGGIVWIMAKLEPNMRGALGLTVGLGILFALIASAVKSLSKIEDTNTLWNAVSAMSVIMAVVTLLGLVFTAMNKDGMMKGSGDVGIMILKVSAGLLILVQAMEKIAAIKDTDALWSGISVIAVLLTAIALFYNTMKAGEGYINNPAKIGFMLLEIVIAMNIMAGALSKMTALDPERIFMTLGSLFAFIYGLTYAANSLKNSSGLVKISASLILLSIGLMALSAAFVLIAKASAQENLIDSILVTIAMLVALTLVSNNLGSGNMLAFSASLIVLAAGLTALLIPLTLMGLIPWGTFIKGFASFMLIIGGIVALGAVLNVLSAPIATFIDATTLLGVSLGILGLGLIFVSKGIDLLMNTIKRFGEAIDPVQIANFIYNIISAIAITVQEAKPLIVQLIVDLLDTILQALIQSFVVIMSNIGQLLTLLVNGIYHFFGGEGEITIWEGIKLMLSKLWDGLKVQLAILVSNITNRIRTWKTAITEAAKYVIDGIVAGFKQKVADVSNSVKNIGNTIIYGFKNVLGIASPSKVMEDLGEYVVDGLVKGISNKESEAENASSGLGSKITNSLGQSLKNVFDLNVDTDPTITPVLDLSNIESGVGEMNDLLDSSSNISANITSADLSSSGISSSMSSDQIVEYFKEALLDMGVYIDGSKVGKLVTTYQANVSKSYGY